MAKHFVTGRYFEGYFLDESRSTWTFGIDAILKPDPTDVVNVAAIRETAEYHDNKIIVHGAIYVPEGSAIWSEGKRTTITLEDDAVIYSAGGTKTSGQGAQVFNHAQIFGTGDSTGFSSSGDNYRFENSGLIRVGTFGVQSTGDNARIVNGQDGYILAGVAAVAFYSEAGEKSQFINHGTVSAAEGVYAGAGDETIRNDGKITGMLILNDGNDTVNTLGGVIVGDIVGGEGDDTLITDKAKHQLYEEAGGGTDTVRSTVSYTLADNVEFLYLLGSKDIDGKGNSSASGNALTGNSGDNVLSGLGGNDGINGGAGNDRLVGGLENDRFYFATGFDRDRIVDLGNGNDIVDLNGWSAIRTFASLKSHASDQGDDVWITAAQDTLVIEGFHKADLTASMFDF